MREFRIVPLLSLGLLAGCASSGMVTLEPLGPRYPPTVWESIEVIRAGSDIQRAFVPLALVRQDGASPVLVGGAVAELQRQASRVGANAIVLEAIEPDGSWAGGASGQWVGVATAIRILDGRWADRYWRYGSSPEALQRSVEPTTPERAAPDSARADPARADPGREPGAGWRSVRSWTGEGIEETEPFHIDAEEWRVTWEATTDDEHGLEILVVQLPGEVLAARIDQDGVGTGSYLGLVGAGTFFLRIRGEAVSWNIAVEVWTP